MEIICTFWIILCVGTSFAQLNDDIRRILEAAKENGIQRGFDNRFNWTFYTAPPLPIIPTFNYPDFNFKNIAPPTMPGFTQYKTEYRDYTKRRGKTIKLILRVVGGVVGLIIAALLWIYKKKSKTDETSTEESSLSSPGSLPEVIPLPYAPLHPQQSRPCPQQEDPNLQPPNLTPLSLTSIRVITKDEAGCPKVVLIPSKPGSPTLRSLIIVRKVPQDSPKE